jgi:putative DNA primase/helicase
MSDNPLLEAALRYAARGWPVFPLWPGTKKPVPENGLHAGTTKVDQIQRWWKTMPTANIGVCCGIRADMWVVDLDCKPGAANGLETLDGLEQTHGQLPITLAQTTPSGGRHLLFRWPDGGERIRNNGKTRRIGPGIDTRGQGGYIVAPPSVIDGNFYDWDEEDMPLAMAPPWLLELVMKEPEAAPLSSMAETAGAPSMVPGELDAYTRKALADEVATVASAVMGSQRDTLNRAAFSLGGLVAKGKLGRGQAKAALLGAVGGWSQNSKDPWTRGQIEKVIDDGLTDGERKPRRQIGSGKPPSRARPPVQKNAPAAAPSSAQEGPPAAIEDEDEDFYMPGGEPPPFDPYPLDRGEGGGGATDLELARQPYSDLGNARRLIARHGGDLLQVKGMGWHAWSGKHWDVSGGESEAKRRAQHTADAMSFEAKALEEAGPREGEKLEDFDARVGRHRKWGVASGNSAKTKAMLEQASVHMERDHEGLNTDPFIFNCQNGTLVFEEPRKGADGEMMFPISLREQRRSDYITWLAPVTYDPNAKSPLFDRFIERVLPDAELRNFVKRYCGYCLTGDTGEQVMALFWGRGANGKSTLVNVLLSIFGAYGTTLPFSSLKHDDNKRGSEATPDLVKLPGRRLVCASEPEQGTKLSEGLIKTLTGGDTMNVRQLNQPFIEFTPVFKLILSFNNKPAVRGQDEGIWRRLLMVPFGIVIPKSERDPDLNKKLLAEKSGILNWMLEGYQEWRDIGLKVPDSVMEATKAYRDETDPLGGFLEAAVMKTPGRSLGAATFYRCYQLWSKENGVDALSQTAFGRSLPDRGYIKSKDSRGSIVYLGVSLHDDLPWMPDPKLPAYGGGEND